MMKTWFSLLLCCIINSLFFSVYSQSKETGDKHSLDVIVPKVALLGVHSSSASISLNGSVSSEAGAQISFDNIDSSTWLNYSSIVGKGTESSRHITVQLSNGVLPEGLQLLAEVKGDTGFGEGEVGTPIPNFIKIGNKPSKIIDKIGSCYTGVGLNRGHNVTYQLRRANKKDYNQLNVQFQQLTLVYTLSDD